jgi:hypothetical protein
VTVPDVLNVGKGEGFIGSLGSSRPPTPDWLVPTPANTPNPELIPNSSITVTIGRRGDPGAKYVALLPTPVPSNGFCESMIPVDVELWILLPPESKEP